jgi:hypothetical protein
MLMTHGNSKIHILVKFVKKYLQKSCGKEFLIFVCRLVNHTFTFIDTSNRAMPDFQKKLGLSIKQSNLCSEIILPTDKQRTAVCCLSSVNLEYYDDWKNDKLFLRDMAEMLDNVLQYFIDNAPIHVKRAKYSASRERSIGVGALGFHAYLQKSNVAFESALAKSRNMQIFKHIRKGLDDAKGLWELNEVKHLMQSGLAFAFLMLWLLHPMLPQYYYG